MATSSPGLLGDSPARNYARKLSLFNAFAEPELRSLIAELRLQPGMQVLDAGCGTGENLNWLHEHVRPQGKVTGIDLSEAHVSEARRQVPPSIEVIQGNLLMPALEASSFDLVWCINTVNHLKDPLAGILGLKRLLKRGGRISIGQGSFLPEMFFAWDSRLERVVNEAVRQYYRDRYGLIERDLTGIRALVGLLRRAQCRHVAARTIVIERTAPLNAETRRYLLEAIFRDTWGSRLSPYLSDDDAAELARLCDPSDSHFALERADFHFLHTFTLVVGES
jgi:ubiquinone/menaquinone biosynthesis C-methylase UbiE